MKTVTFEVKKRDKLGTSNANRLRKNERKVPGVLYGDSKEVVHIHADLVPLEHLFYTAGASTVIELSIEGGEKVDVLIHSVEFHPVRNEIEHIDFMRVDKKKKVHAVVPLEFEGDSEAVRIGGILLFNRHEVEIECLPGDLVHDLKVDVTLIKEIGAHICVSDIVIPKGIVITTDPGVVIAHVEEPKIVADDEPVAEVVTEGEEEGKEEESSE